MNIFKKFLQNSTVSEVAIFLGLTKAASESEVVTKLLSELVKSTTALLKNILSDEGPWSWKDWRLTETIGSLMAIYFTLISTETRRVLENMKVNSEDVRELFGTCFSLYQKVLMGFLLYRDAVKIEKIVVDKTRGDYLSDANEAYCFAVIRILVEFGACCRHTIMLPTLLNLTDLRNRVDSSIIVFSDELMGSDMINCPKSGVEFLSAQIVLPQFVTEFTHNLPISLGPDNQIAREWGRTAKNDLVAILKRSYQLQAWSLHKTAFALMMQKFPESVRLVINSQDETGTDFRQPEYEHLEVFPLDDEKARKIGSFPMMSLAPQFLATLIKWAATEGRVGVEDNDRTRYERAAAEPDEFDRLWLQLRAAAMEHSLQDKWAIMCVVDIAGDDKFFWKGFYQTEPPVATIGE